MDKIGFNRLTGKTVDLLSHALDYRSANHNVISGNLANAETPGFQPKKLSFDSELQRAVEKNNIPLSKTDSKHFSHYTGNLSRGKRNFTIQPQERSPGQSGQLDLDREMTRMVQNNLLFEASTRLLSKKFEALKTAIDAGRK